MKPVNQHSYLTDQSSNKQLRVSLPSGTARHTQNSGIPSPQTAQHRTGLLSQRSGYRTSPPSFDSLSSSQLSGSTSVTGNVVVSAAVYPYSQIYPAPQCHLRDSTECLGRYSLIVDLQHLEYASKHSCRHKTNSLLTRGRHFQQNSRSHKDVVSSSPLLMSL